MIKIVVTVVFCSLIFSLFALNWNSTARLDFYFLNFESVSSMVLGAGGFLLGILLTLVLVATRKLKRGIRNRARKNEQPAVSELPVQPGPAGRE